MGIDSVDHQAGFKEAATPDIPPGVEDGVEENVLESSPCGARSARSPVCMESNYSRSGSAMTRRGGGESVTAGILGTGIFAGFGFGARGKLNIGAVGVELRLRWHRK